MENNLQNISTLLAQITEISKKYDEIAKITGENFNVFTVIGAERWELSHSGLIGELLNPKGSHGKGDVFLSLFVNQLNYKFNINLKDFDSLVEEKIVERNTQTSIDWKNVIGGRIDIILEDKKQILVIENKIDAGNQDYQLIRYSNYAKNRKKDFYILYLTKDGREIDDEKDYEDKKNNFKISGKNFSIKKINEYKEYEKNNSNSENHYCIYYPISYKEDILNWLELCIKEAEDFPMLRETIRQYIYLIKKLTNQTTNHKMTNKIKDLITEDNIDIIPILANELTKLLIETRTKYKESIRAKIKDIIDIKGQKICIDINEDEDGIYVGYQFNCNETSVNSVVGKELKNLLSGVIEEFKVDDNNQYYLGWYFLPILDNKNLLKMHKDESYFSEITQRIISNEHENQQNLLQKI